MVPGRFVGWWGVVEEAVGEITEASLRVDSERYQSKASVVEVVSGSVLSSLKFFAYAYHVNLSSLCSIWVVGVHRRSRERKFRRWSDGDVDC